MCIAWRVALGLLRANVKSSARRRQPRHVRELATCPGAESLLPELTVQ
jgi:hypothetical protein